MAYRMVVSYLYFFINYRWFDRFILSCIIMNAVVLGMFDYTDRDSINTYNKILNYISDAFTAVFFMEASFKICAMGFVMHPLAYLRDPWNISDFIIVISA